MLLSVIIGVGLVHALTVQGMYLRPDDDEGGDQLYTENGEEIFEGDMVLTQKQIDGLFGESKTRKARDDLRSLWPKGHVKYRIGSSSKDDHHVIHKALKLWMSSTCIKFEEISDKSYNKPHLIFRKNSGCHTHVGREPDLAGQVISIGEGCAIMGKIAHEVGHALGFYHEQSRPDRGYFVKIIMDNIKEAHKKNFQIHENINSHGVSYDLGSIMHYGLDTFSENKLNTMVPLDVTKTFVTGQRKELSFYDLKLANMIYNCSASCSSTPTCQNDGYVDMFCKCQCPPGFEGVYCETQRPDDMPLCGGIITEETTITTPNYPQNYPKDITCIWQIEAPKGKHVRVHFHHFDLIYHYSSKHQCPWDVLEVRNKLDLYEGEKFCGEELDNEILKSEGNKMNLLFKSEYDQNKGFTASVKFV